MVADARSTHDDAEHVLALAAEAGGLDLVPATDADLAVDLGQGRVVQLDVRTLSHASPQRVRSLLARNGRRRPGRDRVPVLVADSITAGARKLLVDAGWGWYDRRGHLRLQAPGLLIDTAASAAARASAAPRANTPDQDPVRGRSGLAVALQLLVAPDGPFVVRATARAARLAPSSVSRALERLRDASLVDGSGRPLLPELFWVVADAWPLMAGQALKRTPATNDRWVMSGTRAALAWGAPGVATSSYPAELYVPAERDQRTLAIEYGEAARPSAASVFVRIAPTPIALQHAVPRGERWPLAHPVVVALDLAHDLGRGVEILEGWTPPAPYRRVW